MTDPFKPPAELPPDIPLHNSDDVCAVWRVVTDRRVDIEQVLLSRFADMPAERLREVMQAVFDLLQLYPESFPRVLAMWHQSSDDEVVA